MLHYLWVITYAPWASLLLVASWAFIVIFPKSNQKVLAFAIFPSVLATHLTWYELPPNVSPLVPFEILINVLVNGHLPLLLGMTFEIFEYIAITTVAGALSWIMAGIALRRLVGRNLAVRIVVALLGVVVSFWIYYFPYGYNQDMYGGGSGLLGQPEWLLNIIEHTHPDSVCDLVNYGLGPINPFQPVYLVFTIFLVRSIRKRYHQRVANPEA